MQWINLTVGEYCPFVYGKAIKKQEQYEQGIPVFGSNGVYTYSKNELVKPYAVIIGRKGTVGKVHLSPEPCWVSDTAFYIQYDSIDEARFAYYLLSTLGLEDMNTDAAVPGLNRNNAHRLEVSVPETPEQRQALIEPVVVLDKKIELNRQINQTLEAMAQAMFKSWFVDFEPVKAKMQALENGGTEADANLAAMQAISGKTADQLATLKTQHPEQYQQFHHTARLFPNAMQTTELGEIPVSWDVVPFSDIAALSTKSVKPNKQPETLWEHYSIPAFDSGQQPSLDTGDSIKSNKYVVQQSAILSSKLNPSTERTWLPFIENVETAICSTEFMQFVPINSDDRAFAYCTIRSEPFQHGILSRVTGTTGSRQRAQPKEVSVIQVVKPNLNLTNVFNQQVTPWLNMTGNNQKQIKTLAELRDTLLPKLLSGELQISNEDAA